ncbi:MAG: hypothetical protein RIR77_2092 [Planctomycetota bacterium]|jgi:hypothetical protein
MSGLGTDIPFIFAVTGHRDPDPGCVESAHAQFIALIEKLSQRAPATGLLMLTGLAAGFDQLASAWALEWSAGQPPLSSGGARLQLGVVMPFARESYLSDFNGDPGALREFERIETRAVFVGSVAPWQSSVTQERQDEPRQCGYERLGAVLVERCQLLVAFWDGVDNGLPGGTAWVVGACRANVPTAASEDRATGQSRRRHLLAGDDPKAVHIIEVSRQSTPNIRHPAKYSRVAVIPVEIQTYLDELEELNRLVARYTSAESNGARSQSQSDPSLRSIKQRFSVIDSVAVHMKSKFVVHVFLLTSVTVVAVCSFQWFGTHDHQYWAAFIYLVLMIGALIWHHLIRNVGRVEWAFVHTRAIAEAMRVQISWSASGIDDLVTDHYMARRARDTRTLRSFVNAATIELIASTSGGSVRGLDETSGHVWLRDQISFMRRKLDSPLPPRSLGLRLYGWGTWCFRKLLKSYWVVVLVISVMLAWSSRGRVEILEVKGPPAELMSVSTAAVADSHNETTENWLPFGVFIVGSLLFLKVGVEYHDGAVLSEDDLEQYERLLPVFERAQALLDRGHGTERVLRAVGKEALDEHAEWYVRHMDSLRPPNVG